MINKSKLISSLELVQRELREFYSRDKDSQALMELKEQLKLLKKVPDDVIGILDVDYNTVPENVFDLLYDNKLYTYADMEGSLDEHLFSAEVKEKAVEEGLELSYEEEKFIDFIASQCAEKDCGYFRIIKI